jgi:hypothetical protein
MNRNWRQRENVERQQRIHARNPPTAIEPLIAHPHRSLPPGKQYLAHDGNGARARRLRQQRALEAKRLRKQAPANPDTDVAMPQGPTRVE